MSRVMWTFVLCLSHNGWLRDSSRNSLIVGFTSYPTDQPTKAVQAVSAPGAEV